MRIVVGITSPGSTPLIRGQLEWFSRKGHEVYLACPSDDAVTSFCEEEGVRHVPIEIARDIRPLQDLKSLFDLYRAFRRIRPDVVNVGTPKMGVLGSIAALMTSVPMRIYTCRGFRYEHERGFRKRLLMAMERIAARCSRRVLCISDSVRKKGIEDQVFRPAKTRLIPPGSSNGIDVGRFNQGNVDPDFAANLRRELDLEGKFVIGFVGRLIDRKGILELYQAFCRIRADYSEVKLVLVGSKFDDQLSVPWLLDEIEADPDIHWIGFQEDVVTCLSLFDLFVLPAWWEGFGNVLVQAAAMGLPVISTDVTGCKDAVSHGYNGTLVQKGNVEQIVNETIRYMQDTELRQICGANGIDWASRFEPEKIWSGLEQIYLQNDLEPGSLETDVDDGKAPRILFVATSDIHLHVFHRPHIEWLVSNGYRVDVAAETRRGYQISGINAWHELKFARELSNVSHFPTLLKLRKVIRRGNYSLISCHTPIPGALTRLAVRRLPRDARPRVVYMAHGFHFSRGGSFWNWLIYFPAESVLSRQSDAIVVINREDLEHTKSARFHSKSFLVPGIGVDINRFQPVDHERKLQLRRELGFSRDDFILMYIGEFILRKNHRFIVDCADKLAGRFPVIRIVFVGKGRLGARLASIVKRRGLQDVVRFTGFREDVERYACISDIGISSSKREGLGLGLAEQMACGLPVVASGDKGHRELIDDGVNGFLYPQGDQEAFMEAIARLHDDPGLRQKMGEESRCKALGFSVEASVGAMAGVYRATMGGRNESPQIEEVGEVGRQE